MSCASWFFNNALVDSSFNKVWVFKVIADIDASLNPINNDWDSASSNQHVNAIKNKVYVYLL